MHNPYAPPQPLSAAAASIPASGNGQHLPRPTEAIGSGGLPGAQWLFPSHSALPLAFCSQFTLTKVLRPCPAGVLSQAATSNVLFGVANGHVLCPRGRVRERSAIAGYARRGHCADDSSRTTGCGWSESTRRRILFAAHAGA